MLVEGYIRLTNDEYMLVKLTEKAKELLDGSDTLVMKMAKEQEKQAKKESGKKKKSAGAGQLKAEDEPLFESLRSLRMEIARKENVPPYIVFSDKSLIHMCIIRPKTKAEMLTVSGVGEFKFAKYGERFLEAINR